MLQLTRGTRTCTMLNLGVHTMEHENPILLRNLLRIASYNLTTPTDINLDTLVLRHGAVIAQNKLLVNVGTFVQVDNTVSEALVTLYTWAMCCYVLFITHQGINIRQVHCP